ncbi:hypothetical protein [Oscillibacter sp.]|uniref:hypothetical protein n=1 Tax=Oscillibacter sp. TaxID=1945593 RepID=UPI00289D8999|nr:hypothetical protein [Oscillibacter sp.]
MIVCLFALGLALLIVGNFVIWKQKTITRITVEPASLRLNFEKGKNKISVYWQEAETGVLGYGEFEVGMLAVHQTGSAEDMTTIQIQKNGFHEVTSVNIYTPEGITFNTEN